MSLKGVFPIRAIARHPSISPRIGLLIAAFMAHSLAGQTWTHLSPGGTPPSARGFNGTTGVYDPSSDRMIVFGGRDGSGNNLNDVWVLTNANGLGGPSQWVNLIPNGATGSPPARSGHSAAYDSVNNVMIVFGGCSGYCTPALNDVWTLSNANGLGGTPVWTELPLDDGPAARTNAVAGYDPTRNQLFIYAGQDGSADPCSTLSDVWSLSNANGLGVNPAAWAQLSFPNPPPGPNAAAAIYQPATSTMTVFGGTALVNGVCQDTNAVWDLTLGSPFVSLAILMPDAAAGSPPPRSSASAVYDPTGERMLIFGGVHNSAQLADVWGLFVTGAPVWQQLKPSGAGPPVRDGQAAIFDTANQRMTIFGGTNTSGVLNDTWVLAAPLPYPPLSCTSNAGAPNLVHAEGIADFAGDLVLNCTGGSPTPQGEPIPEYKITLTLNTNVTSQLLPHGPKLSEALLMIDDPFPASPFPSFLSPFPSEPPQILCTPLGGTCAETGTGGSPSPYQSQPNVFVGKQITAKSLQWQIPIDPPGVNLTRVIRLTNVRADASQLGVPTGFVPTEVKATVGIQGAEPVAVAAPQQIVALGVAGADVSVTASNPILQCVPHNASLVGGSGVAAFDFSTQIAEAFSYSFKNRNYGTEIFGVEFPEPLSEQNVPGFVYRTETGLYSPSLFTAAPTLGLADFGTRIRVKFESLPAGVRLFVPIIITMTGNDGFDIPGQVQLVQANDDGLSSAGYEPVSSTAMVGTTPVAEVSYLGSTAYAIYESLYADSSVTETVTVPVAVAFTRSPVAGQVKMVSSLAPVSSSETASASAPLPRFASIYAAQPAFSVEKCPVSTLSAAILSKTGPENARVWNIQVNSGADAAAAAQIESLTLVQSPAPTCTPAITSPAFPVALGDIAANGSVTTPVTIDFTGCSSGAHFNVDIALSANGGASNASVVEKHQTP
jgi:hypothetical protein